MVQLNGVNGLLSFDPRSLPSRSMKTIRDISKSLKGVVSPQERFFRVMVHYFITKGRSVLLYDEDKFKEYIMTIEGEDSDMYKFLILRRHEFMMNVEDILLRGLTETRN